MALGSNVLQLIITAKDNASAAIANVAKGAEDASKSLSGSSKQLGSFASQAGSAFDNVAGSIENLAKKAAILTVGSAFGAHYFINLAGSLDTTQRQMAVLTGSTEAANKVFGELYNYTLGKPIAFPDASKAAATLLGYGRTVQTVQGDMETLSKLSIVNGGDLQNLAVVYGQITSRGALFGQDALQLINNNIPLTTILAKHFGISMEEASKKINGGTVSAQEFVQAMKDYSASLDINSMQDSFKNRMISLQGTLRSTGLAILGIRIDPIKGFVVDADGLFAKFSDAVSNATHWLKDHKETIVGVAKMVLNNLVPALIAIGSAWAGLKIASWISSIGALTNPFAILAAAVGAVAGAIGVLYSKNEDFRNGVNKLAEAVGQYLWPKIQGLWKAIRDDLIPTLSDAWKNWLGPLAQFIGTVVVGAIGLLIDALSGVVKGFSYVYNKIKEGDGFWLGLITTLGVVAAAIAMPAAFAAFGTGIAMVGKLFAGLAAVVASPIIMPALVIGAAVWSLTQVYKLVTSIIDLIHSMSEAADAARQKQIADSSIIPDMLNIAQNGASMGKTPAQINAAKAALHGAGYPGYALGTNYAKGGLTLVGENGPELVNMPRGSQVYSNSDSRKMGAGATVTVGSVNIYNQMDEQKFLKNLGWRLAIA